MGFRDAFVKVISMKVRGASHEKIYDYVRGMAQRLGGGLSEGDSSSFEVRLIATGAAISFNGRDYSYRL
jgi:hypothetical protein